MALIRFYSVLVLMLHNAVALIKLHKSGCEPTASCSGLLAMIYIDVHKRFDISKELVVSSLI